MNRILYLLFVCFCIFSCSSKQEKVIIIENSFVKIDSLHLILKDNESELINQYIKKGETSDSYIKFKKNIKDGSEIIVELPKWKIESKKQVLDCDTIIIVISTAVDEEFLKRKMKEINTIKDSALIPRINIDCR